MSFIEDHPEYKQYISYGSLHFHSIPTSAWSEFESLVDKAGGPDRESLSKVVQMLATKVGYGNVADGYPYQWISDIVSKLRSKANNGRLDLFMDCLELLCIDGEIGIDDINVFLEENEFGYRAVRGWNNHVSWEKIEEECEFPRLYQISEKESADKIIKYESVAKKLEGCQPMRNSIFISHRTIDSDFASMILDFLVACGIPRDKIFCSSLPGNDVDEQISPEVKQRLKEATIIVLLLSKSYYESAYCINEAGVAWYLDDVIAIPFGLPEINHSDMVGFLNSDYKLRRLENEEDISYLYDQAQERLNVKVVKHSIITQEIKKLLNRYQKCIEDRNISISINEVDEDFDFGDLDDTPTVGQDDVGQIPSID